MATDKPRLAWTVIFGVEMLAVFVGNAIAIAVFWKQRSTLKRTYYLLINLSIADVLVGLGEIENLVNNAWYFIHATPANWGNFAALDVFSALASIFLNSYLNGTVIRYCLAFPAQNDNNKSLHLLYCNNMELAGSDNYRLLMRFRIRNHQHENRHHNRSIFLDALLGAYSILVLRTMDCQEKRGSEDTSRQTRTKQEACYDFIHCKLIIGASMAAFNSELHNILRGSQRPTKQVASLPCKMSSACQFICQSHRILCANARVQKDLKDSISIRADISRRSAGSPTSGNATRSGHTLYYKRSTKSLAELIYNGNMP